MGSRTFHSATEIGPFFDRCERDTLPCCDPPRYRYSCVLSRPIAIAPSPIFSQFRFHCNPFQLPCPVSTFISGRIGVLPERPLHVLVSSAPRPFSVDRLSRGPGPSVSRPTQVFLCSVPSTPPCFASVAPFPRASSVVAEPRPAFVSASSLFFFCELDRFLTLAGPSPPVFHRNFFPSRLSSPSADLPLKASIKAQKHSFVGVAQTNSLLIVSAPSFWPSA